MVRRALESELGAVQVGSDEPDEDRRARHEAYTAFQQLIDKIVVIPVGNRSEKSGQATYSVKIYGQLAALMSHDGECREAVVAGVGFEPTTFRL